MRVTAAERLGGAASRSRGNGPRRVWDVGGRSTQ